MANVSLTDEESTKIFHINVCQEQRKREIPSLQVVCQKLNKIVFCYHALSDLGPCHLIYFYRFG